MIRDIYIDYLGNEHHIATLLGFVPCFHYMGGFTIIMNTQKCKYKGFWEQDPLKEHDIIFNLEFLASKQTYVIAWFWWLNEHERKLNFI